MYFYIQDNKDWNYENKVKFGITENYNERLKTDQHSYKSEYISLFKYEIDYENYRIPYKEIDNIISKQKRDYVSNVIENEYPLIKFEYLFKIKEFLINNGGGTEFIRKEGIELLEKILLEDFKKIGIIIRKIPKEEWEIEEEEVREYQEVLIPNFNSNDVRDYQQIIIDDALNNIKNYKRVYISLATGGGKSFIVYKIMNELLISTSTIIILTPRINICQQNIKNKYLKLLSNTYKIYDKDNLYEINKDENNIICCCINSYKKVVDIIKEVDLKDVIIWFDEAHYGIDSWIIKSNEDKRFLLEDNEYIRYRIYTSASPDKDFVSKNNRIFGELVNPIKIKYLMENNYLCKLNPYIYKEDIEDDLSDKSFVNFIIANFKKNVGLCFCNTCENASNLFKYHLKLYEKDKNIPKPFLLHLPKRKMRQKIAFFNL